MTESLKKQTYTGIIWSAVDVFSVQGVQFIFGLILARLLSPSDYGTIALLFVLLSICQAIVDSGFSNALVRKIDRDEKDYATVFYFNVVVGLVLYIFLFFCSPFIASFYNQPILDPLSKVVCLNVIFNSLCVVQQARLMAIIDFKTQAKVSVIATTLSGIIGILAALFGLGVWSLAFQSVASAALRMVFLWFLANWIPTEKFSKESFKEMFAYGSKLLATSLMNAIFNNLYTIAIGKFYIKATLGNYSRAQNFANLPSSNITNIIQRVTFPVMSKIQFDEDRLRDVYRRFLKLLAYIVFPIMVMLSALADPLIRFLLTDKWEGAIILLQISSLALMWYPIHAINLNLLQVKGRSDLFLYLEIWKISLSVTMLIVTIPLGIVGMCYGTVVSSLIALVINTYYTGRLINMGFWKQMNDLFPILLNCIILGIIVLLIVNNMPPINLLKLIIGSIAGCLYYIFTSIIFKSSELKELLSIMRKNLNK